MYDTTVKSDSAFKDINTYLATKDYAMLQEARK